MEPAELADDWVIVTEEWFEEGFALPAGIEIDRSKGTLRAPFGPEGVVGSRIRTRNGLALFVEKPTSGVFRVDLE